MFFNRVLPSVDTNIILIVIYRLHLLRQPFQYVILVKMEKMMFREKSREEIKLQMDAVYGEHSLSALLYS